MQWQYEEFHNMEHHPLIGEGERYPDFDDIPDDWIPKRKPVLNESLVFQPNTQYGSNEGGIHVDSDTGTKHYVKYPVPEQAHVEAAMSELYNAWGIKTVNPKVIVHDNRTAVTSDWDDNLTSIKNTKEYDKLMQNAKHADSLAKMHHAAIITGNRDILGLVGDNILHDTKHDSLVSLDQGGSMHYRAQGGNKPYEPNIDELTSFRNPRYMISHVLSSIDKHHPESFKRAIEPFKQVSDGEIREILNKHHLSDYADTMIKRKNLLVNHYT